MQKKGEVEPRTLTSTGYSAFSLGDWPSSTIDCGVIIWYNWMAIKF